MQVTLPSIGLPEGHARDETGAPVPAGWGFLRGPKGKITDPAKLPVRFLRGPKGKITDPAKLPVQIPTVGTQGNPAGFGGQHP